MEFYAIDFKTAGEAIQYADAGGGRAILLDGPTVVSQADVHRLEAAGVEFAFLCDHEMPDGTFRIISVPVN